MERDVVSISSIKRGLYHEKEMRWAQWKYVC